MKNKKCNVWWCENPHYALGWCKPHWEAVRRFGSPYGKSKKRMQKIDDIIQKSRLVSIRVLEFAQTEFVRNFANGHGDSICPFCLERNNEHKPLCIVNLSKSILESSGVSFENLNDSNNKNNYIEEKKESNADVPDH